MKKLIVLLIVLFCNLACQMQKTNRNLEFEVLEKSEFGAEMQAQNQLITTPQDFAKIQKTVFANQSPQPKIKNVDFNKKNVIFIHLGTYSYGGNAFEVTKVEQIDTELIIDLYIDSPGMGEPALTVITYPFVFIEIDKPHKEIQNIQVNKTRKK